MPFEAMQIQASSLQACPSEPASVGVLGYAGIALDELALPFRWLARRSNDGHAAFEAALVAPQPGVLGLAGGAAVGADHALDVPLPAFDLLIVPAGLPYASEFGSRGSIAMLADAALRAGQVLVASRLAREARCAHVLLRAASTLPVATFWTAVGTRRASDPTTIIADGHVTWAIGDKAIADGLRCLVGEDG